MPNEFILLSGSANPKLARDIGKILKKPVDEPISYFSDGETRVKIAPNLRQRSVFIIQPTTPPVNDHVMELILLIDAVKRSSAKEITAVIPYFGYARQDRKEMSRVPISSSALASIYEHAGADRILTVDIHSEQQEGFVRGPWDNVYASYSFLPAFQKRGLKDVVIASPDKGGMVRAAFYAKLLHARGIAIVYKERDINVNDASEALAMIGEVKDKDILLVDDMVSTGGTLFNAADYIAKKGARTVRAAITHGLFSGNALERLSNSAIKEVFVTDTIGLRDEIVKHPKITVVSVAPLLAETIKRILTGESISKLILKPSIK